MGTLGTITYNTASGQGGGMFSFLKQNIMENNLENWVGWLRRRITEIDEKGAARFWVRQALTGYAEDQVKNCRIDNVSNNEVKLKALLQKLLEENMCSVVGDELIRETLKSL